MSKLSGVWSKIVGFIALFAAFVASPSVHAQEHTLKIGTLVPKSSPWGKVFVTWEMAVNEKSGGRLALQFFYNGQQGDEGAMVGKIKSGQLHGAAVSGVGLGKVYKPITALQMPGLFSSWGALDAARDALSAEFMKGASDAGFTVLGWYDVGATRTLSKGFDLRKGTDFRGKKPFVWRDDVIFPVTLQVIGGVSGVSLNIPEVLPNLNTGAINIVNAGALEAEQFQWASKLDRVAAEPHAFAIGGLIMSTKQLDALPADLKAILVDTGKVAAAALKTRIRSEDNSAYTRLAGKMTKVTPTAAEKDAWNLLYKQVRARLAQGTFDPGLVTRLESMSR